MANLDQQPQALREPAKPTPWYRKTWFFSDPEFQDFFPDITEAQVSELVSQCFAEMCV